MFSRAVQGAIIASAITSTIVLNFFTPTESLKTWYKLGSRAILLDITSISLGAYVGLAAGAKLNFLGLGLGTGIGIVVAVIVGVLHDFSFGKLLEHLPNTEILSVFKAYGDEKRARILLDDALIIIGAIVIAQILTYIPNSHANAITSIFFYVNILLVDAISSY